MESKVNEHWCPVVAEMNTTFKGQNLLKKKKKKKKVVL